MRSIDCVLKAPGVNRNLVDKSDSNTCVIVIEYIEVLDEGMSCNLAFLYFNDIY